MNSLSRALVLCALFMFNVSAMADGAQRTQRAINQAAAQQAPVDLSGLQPSAEQKAHAKDVIERAGKAAVNTALPRVDAPPQTPIDIAAMARSLDASVPDAVKSRPTGPLVFVSLSMPSASLMKLSQDAKRVNAVLVMRGMVDGSLRKTAEAMQAYSRLGVNLVIDPQAFERHAITVVPSFVIDLSEDPSASCKQNNACMADRSAVVEGDVGLAHALRGIERRAKGRLKGAAVKWIKDLES